MTYFDLLYLTLNPLELGIVLCINVSAIVCVLYMKKHHIKLFD